MSKLEGCLKVLVLRRQTYVFYDQFFVLVWVRLHFCEACASLRLRALSRFDNVRGRCIVIRETVSGFLT
ncbi:hypothetical protein BVRB_3g066560 [Beta vulgaris subsp. vulgaris]|nr:hypothetical protein BVRB_3g066560 [Beta vulgaris subsp. vulgaris]